MKKPVVWLGVVVALAIVATISEYVPGWSAEHFLSGLFAVVLGFVVVCIVGGVAYATSDATDITTTIASIVLAGLAITYAAVCLAVTFATAGAVAWIVSVYGPDVLKWVFG